MSKKDMFNKKQSNMISLILGALFLSTLFLSVAYAAMSTTLKITSNPIELISAEYYYYNGTFYNGNGDTTGTSTGKTKLSDMISIIPQASNIYFKSIYLVSANEDVTCMGKTINLIRHPSLTAAHAIFYVNKNVVCTLCSGTTSDDATGQITFDGNKDKLATKSERALVVVDRSTLNLRGNIEFTNSETTQPYGSAIDNIAGHVEQRFSGKFWVHDNISVGKGAICNRIYETVRPSLLLYSTNNTIENNTSTAGDGGGIYNNGLVDCQSGNTTINNNRCEAGNGGGICSSGIYAWINITSSLTVSNNYASLGGGGIYSSGNTEDGITMGSSGTLNVTGNETSTNTNASGGGLLIDSASANFDGNILNIDSNKASYGGGMSIKGSSSVEIHCTNTTFSGNWAQKYAGAIYCAAGTMYLGCNSWGNPGGTVTFQDNTAPEYSIVYINYVSKCHLTTSIYNNIYSESYFYGSYTLH